MVSAYYILKNKAIKQRVFERGLKDYLNFDGTIILDSGVFQLINSGKEVNIQEIIDLYRQIDGADIKLSFDFPDDKIVEQYEKLRHLEVEPIIPANQLDLIEYFQKNKNKWIFIGRLAIKLKEKGWRGFDFLKETANFFSKNCDKKLWALGVGNYKTAPYLFNAGFEGADTSSYRIAAAYGDVIVPNKGTRHISGRKNLKKQWGMPLVQENEISLFLDKLDFTFLEVKENFEKRALFNAFILTDLFNHS